MTVFLHQEMEFFEVVMNSRKNSVNYPALADGAS